MNSTTTNHTSEVKPYWGSALQEFKKEGVPAGTFEATGESMNNGRLHDVKSGYLLLAEEVSPDEWPKKLKPNKYGYVFSTTENSYHKDVQSYDPETNTVNLTSRNPEAQLQSFSLKLNDECAVYKVVKIQG